MSRAKNYGKHILRGLLLTSLIVSGSGCAPRVSSASSSALKQLNQNAIPPPKYPPSQSLHWDFNNRLPRHPTSIRVPLLSYLNVPAVPAQLNGAPIHLILDTGASNVPLLLEAQTAARTGVHPLKGIFLKGSGVGGSVRVGVGRFESLRLGGLVILGAGHTGILLQSYSETIAGITVRKIPLNLLGMKTLSTFSYVAIDAPRAEVEFGIHTLYAPGATERSFDFAPRKDGPRVPLQVGERTIEALLDTGCSSPLSLNGADLKKIAAENFKSPPSRPQKSMGVAGLETSRRGVLREVRIGAIRMAPVDFDSTAPGTDSILGWGAFRKHRMVLDFQRRKVWVSGTPNGD